MIVVDDFNIPSSSCVDCESFGDLTNAFESAVFGFGFTALCKGFRHWPSKTPRPCIDLVLANPSCEGREYRIGEHDGSDHRLISVVMQLRIK